MFHKMKHGVHVLDAFDDLRLRDLVLLDRVVALGTITAAARELGVPKPTAGRWLSQLEDRVGGALLHRGARRVALTDRGRAVHQGLQPILRSASALRSVVQRETPGGTLRVSVPVPLGRLLGGAVIAAFHEQLPAVRLEVLLQNHRVDLLRDRVDVALRGGPLPDSSLLARRLATVPMWLFASMRYRGASPSTIPVIAAPGDERLLTRVLPALPGASVVVDDRTAVRDALEAGAGAGILPGFLGDEPLRRGVLFRLRDEPLSQTAVHALWLAEQRGDPRIRALVTLIEGTVAQWTGGAEQRSTTSV